MLGILPLVAVSAMASTAPSDASLALAARAVLSEKCTQCHGPDLAFPKSGFGFVTDLRRLASTPRLIVPGRPDRSRLWHEIDDGEMPPDNARAGPLSEEQKGAVLAWISAGAPDDPSRAADPDPPAQAPWSRWIEFLGRLHVIAVHFPIGLLASAAAVECLAVVRRRPAPAGPVRAFLAIGCLGAAIAAGLGWVHAMDSEGAAGSVLWVHRWLGTATAGAAALALVLSESDVRRGHRRGFTRAAILILGALAGAAGHFGGVLTHGPGFLTP